MEQGKYYADRSRMKPNKWGVFKDNGMCNGIHYDTKEEAEAVAEGFNQSEDEARENRRT